MTNPNNIWDKIFALLNKVVDKSFKLARDLLIDEIPNIVGKLAETLPNDSATKLNYAADVLGLIALFILVIKNLIPSDQVLAAFSFYLIFVLVCVFGAFIANQHPDNN